MKCELQDIINDCTSEIADIENRILNMPALDKEVRYLTNYTLIKVSGTLEFVYRSIVADYFTKYADSKVDTYIDSTIRNGPMSAKYEQMCNLLSKFDDSWCKSFKNIVSSTPNSNQLISSSNSLVTNRHCFAHGKAPTATFMDIKQYYQDVLQLIHLFDSVVK